MGIADFAALGAEAAQDPTREKVQAFQNFHTLGDLPVGFLDVGVPIALGAIGAGAFGFGPVAGGGLGGGAGGVAELGNSPFLSGMDAGAIAGADFAGVGGLGVGLAEGEAGAGNSPFMSGMDEGAVAGADFTGTASPSMLTAASPTLGLDPQTAAALGIDAGGFDTATGMVPGGAPTFGGAEGFGSMGEFAGEPTGQFGGPTGRELPTDPGFFDSTSALLKKMGLSPGTAGLLGLSAFQGLSKPKLPESAKALQAQAGPAAAQANAVISSGGTSGPQWATQKSSIDASIDQQIKEQTAAMVQQAVNSGQGADSQVTLQQINKLKTQAETARQQLYAQAQAQNVQAALAQLGISDQALERVAQTQFAQSAQAREGAARTAGLALMLNAMGK